MELVYDLHIDFSIKLIAYINSTYIFGWWFESVHPHLGKWSNLTKIFQRGWKVNFTSPMNGRMNSPCCFSFFWFLGFTLSFDFFEFSKLSQWWECFLFSRRNTSFSLWVVFLFGKFWRYPSRFNCQMLHVVYIDIILTHIPHSQYYMVNCLARYR